MSKLWPAVIAMGAAGWYASDSLRHRREQGQGYELRGEDVQIGSDAFLRATEAITMAPIAHGNDIDLLVNGDQIFPAMIETMRGAQRSLNFLSYLYWSGEIGSEIADALCDRAKAGVEVNVLLDAVGSVRMDRGLIYKMDRAGVTFTYFRPPKPYAVRRLNNRTHRKVLIADGKVGMTGGVGIADQWTGNAQDPEHWRDTHVRVRGPIVRGLQGAFAENWLEATGEVLVGPAYLPPLEPLTDDGPMQVVRSTATVGDTNIEALYFLAIECARRSLHLTSAYFAPRPAFVQALTDAARRGVDVRVLVPGPYVDKEFVRQAGRAVYEELLEGGVEIFEYSPTMMHAKTLTIDGVWSSVGSVNFDNRSFQLQDEVTLCVCSRRFAGQLDEQFERDLERSERIDLGRWNGRPLTNRATETLTKVARREL
ncbi:MAG TPA: phospholipase D-like domain-containing protein [Solirubrobacteraceae bacterium]|nr:phospholipase D-like domain-containing protein [Solirubrobacteraceae bacterium]